MALGSMESINALSPTRHSQLVSKSRSCNVSPAPSGSISIPRDQCLDAVQDYAADEELTINNNRLKVIKSGRRPKGCFVKINGDDTLKPYYNKKRGSTNVKKWNPNKFQNLCDTLTTYDPEPATYPTSKPGKKKCLTDECLKVKKNRKCKRNEASASCTECGCTSCPCCISGTDRDGKVTCPPQDSMSCQNPSVSNGGEDPLACAEVAIPISEVCMPAINRTECNNIEGKGGNKCMWYAFASANKTSSGSDDRGKCLQNPCADVNDGSCTLEKTGGRCVWYGNPDRLRKINGVWEKPNPYRKNSGCYTSPCNNPSGTNYFTGEARRNSPRGCEAENPYNPYQCQWCAVKTATQGMTLGCQNVATTSTARASRMADFPEQGGAPCRNYVCNFFTAPGRTNRGKGAHTQYKTEGVTPRRIYNWADEYGTGKASDMCTCTKGDAISRESSRESKAICPTGKNGGMQPWDPQSGAWMVAAPVTASPTLVAITEAISGSGGDSSSNESGWLIPLVTVVGTLAVFLVFAVSKQRRDLKKAEEESRESATSNPETIAAQKGPGGAAREKEVYSTSKWVPTLDDGIRHRTGSTMESGRATRRQNSSMKPPRRKSKKGGIASE